MKKNILIGMALALILGLNGCGSDTKKTPISGGNEINETNDTTETNETSQNSNTFSVVTFDATDASKSSKFNLSSGKTVEDDSWHFSYQKYIGFAVNGGTSGSGDVSACIGYEYASLFDAEGKAVQSEFEKLTAKSTKSTFESVKKDDCNTTQFKTDTITTQIKTSDWLDADYSQGAPVFSAKTDSNNSWIIRSSDSTTYARVKVKTLEVIFGANTTRKVVLASEKWNGTSFDTPLDSPALDYSADDKIYWDLETNDIVTETDAWELAISVVGRDYPIQVNGGASGRGKAGVGLVLNGDATSVTDPSDTAQVYKYFGDSAKGTMSKPGGYGALEYSVASQHKMWPTFAVYIYKKGDVYYKAQVLSNYGSDGALGSGNITVRYEKFK